MLVFLKQYVSWLSSSQQTSTDQLGRLHLFLPTAVIAQSGQINKQRASGRSQPKYAPKEMPFPPIDKSDN